MREIRTERRLSQAQLGEWLQTSQTSVSDWESGYVNVGYDDLLKLSEVFGVPVMYWFYGGDMRDSRTIGNGLRP